MLFLYDSASTFEEIISSVSYLRKVDEEKGDRNFGGCLSAGRLRDVLVNMRVTAKQRQYNRIYR